MPKPSSHSRSRRGPVRPARPAGAARGTAANAIRLVVADHQAIDRGGVIRLLEGEPDMRVIGEAATVAEAIEQCGSLKPNVLVITLNLPGQENDAAVPAIREALPQLRILALSERGTANCLVLNPPSRPRTHQEMQLVCECGMDCLQLAVHQGAMGTLRRSADPEDLFRAVRAVAAGQAWYDASTAGGMLQISRPGGPDSGSRALSDRELDVAALIAEGHSNKEISTALDISEPTVKKHVGRILEKLGFQDRLQAGLFLARNPLALKPRG